MKRFLLYTLLLIMCCTSISATQKEVILHTIEVLSPKGPKSGIPIVQEDENDITISCDTILYNVDVVIKDQFGSVMHHSVESIGPVETVIFVPEDDGFIEKTTIDLYYDRRHFSGEFNE